MRVQAPLILGFVGAACLTGCKKEAEDTGPPPREDIVLDTGTHEPDTFEIPEDTANEDPFPGITPTATLTVEYWGTWTLVFGGKKGWIDVTGNLHVRNLLNGEETDPFCYWIFEVDGTMTEDSCPTCDIHFDIDWTLQEPRDVDLDPKDETPYETGIGNCDPHDIPTDGANWRMGYSTKERRLYNDLDKTGIWVPVLSAEGKGLPNEIVMLARDNRRTWPYFYEDTGL